MMLVELQSSRCFIVNVLLVFVKVTVSSLSSMIPCSAARPRTEKYMSTPPPGPATTVRGVLPVSFTCIRMVVYLF